MSRWLTLFYRLLTALAAVAMVTAFVDVMLGIVSRRLGFNIRGLDAYAGYAIAAALFLALPGTLRNGDHIRVTLLLQQAPKRLRNALEYWCLVAGILVSLYLAWYACRLVWLSKLLNDVSQAADATPLWIPQISMALGCIGFALALMEALLARLKGRRFYASETEVAHIE